MLRIVLVLLMLAPLRVEAMDSLGLSGTEIHYSYGVEGSQLGKGIFGVSRSERHVEKGQVRFLDEGRIQLTFRNPDGTDGVQEYFLGRKIDLINSDEIEIDNEISTIRMAESPKYYRNATYQDGFLTLLDAGEYGPPSGRAFFKVTKVIVLSIETGKCKIKVMDMFSESPSVTLKASLKGESSCVLSKKPSGPSLDHSAQESDVVQGVHSGSLDSRASGVRTGSNPDPDLAAVRACFDSIMSSVDCGGWLQVDDIRKVDRRISPNEAVVISEIDFTVLRSFSGNSQISYYCTGTEWDMDPKKVESIGSGLPMIGLIPGSEKENRFLVGQKLRVRKNFSYQKYESGWRCTDRAMAPVDAGYYLSR